MKRKTTELEKKLIQDGWRLHNKVYEGKKSEKTSAYIYAKEEGAFVKILQLNPKREEIIKVAINNIDLHTLTHETVQFINKIWLDLKQYATNLCLPKEPIPQELLESQE